LWWWWWCWLVVMLGDWVVNGPGRGGVLVRCGGGEWVVMVQIKELPPVGW
jgi:hypothetical protein